MARWLARTSFSTLVNPTPSSMPAGWIVAIRLGERNKAILDYLLLTTTSSIGRLIRFSEKARARHGIDLCTENLNAGVAVMKSAQDGA
jgi:hypothetical protein